MLAALAWCCTAAPASPAAETIPIALVEGLSGSFGNAGEAVQRNLLLAVERVNRRGGVRLPGAIACEAPMSGPPRPLIPGRS